MGFSPTEQQQEIVRQYKGGNNTVIEALAGTGKTTTLNLMSQATRDEKILYVAFNKAIATDAAKSFPRHVDCRTMHSLAFRTVGVKYKDKLNGPRITGRQTAAILGIHETFELDPFLGLFLSPVKLGRIVMDTVKNFRYSGDPEPEAKHVPKVPGGERTRDELREYITPMAKFAWEDLQSHNGRLRFSHDDYLKMFQILVVHSDKPIKLGYDVILFDEAQDSNPATSSIVLSQDNSQLIAVGDRNQQIYSWRGAEDAMQSWPADVRLPLTQSFRFGEGIATEANKWLELLEAELRLEGLGSPSQLGPISEPDAVLCRSNAGTVDTAMNATKEGKKVAIVGGTSEIRMFAEAARDLKAGQSTMHPELAAFQTWDQVKEYVDEGADPDLKRFVTLIDNYGVDTVLEIAATTVEESEADLIVSTAHRSKGREWKSVRIGPDFKEPEPDKDEDEDQFSKPEAMLAYVSVTRAKQQLDCDGLAWVNYYIKQGNNDYKESIPVRDSVAQGDEL